MLDYVEEVLAASDLTELWERHVRRMSEFGFTRLIYTFNRMAAAADLGDLNDALVLAAHDRLYLNAFIGDGLYRFSPALRWAAENSGAAPWDSVNTAPPCAASEAGRAALDALNARFSVSAGYIIAFPEQSNRMKGVMSLGGAAHATQSELDAVWKVHGREIEAMNWVVHSRLSTLPHAGARRPLTRRQREVLELIAEGKSISGAAASLGLSVATVEKHLRLARAALDVETTAAALHKANWQNQIFVGPT